MDIQYNSWLKKFKEPFGAVEVNQFVDFNIQVDSIEPITSVFLIVTKDKNQTVEYPMTQTNNNEYSCRFQASKGSGLYYYCFRIDAVNEESKSFSIYYGKSEIDSHGWQYVDVSDINWYQLTCYREKDKSPKWFKEAIFYQIFPDRFFNGNPDNKINSPKKNSFIYGTQADKPMYIRNVDGSINRWDFFGGNLKGIQKKIPYLKKLGITAIYLNPIFTATSNHRYDTNDYFTIDPMLGDMEEFKELIYELHKNDMKIVLDGVFSHVGKDSRYFNYSGSYGSTKGAYRNKSSEYYNWFTFKTYPDDYESWWGIEDLPKVNKLDKTFQNFIYGEAGVLDYWTRKGVDGWRLDVADELPNFFLEGIRKKLNEFDDTVLIGEVWEDASNKVAYGEEKEYASESVLHTVMNYPFRDAILDLINHQKPIKEIIFDLMTLKENYPHHFYESLFNNIGTHDTKRLLTECDNSIKKVKLAFSLLFMMPGVPCIYYGDEAGLNGGKDPENRSFYPWKNPDRDLISFCQTWIHRRKQHSSIRDGQAFFMYSIEKQLFAIYRKNDIEESICYFNFTNDKQKLTEINWRCEDLSKETIGQLTRRMLTKNDINPQEFKFIVNNL